MREGIPKQIFKGVWFIINVPVYMERNFKSKYVEPHLRDIIRIVKNYRFKKIITI